MKGRHFFSRHRRGWILLSVCTVLVILYLSILPLQSGIHRILAALSSGKIDQVASLIRSFGSRAVLASFFFMVFQSVIAPLPAFLITFANAAIFGWWQGAILSWVSAMPAQAFPV